MDVEETALKGCDWLDQVSSGLVFRALLEGRFELFEFEQSVRLHFTKFIGLSG